jgi:hypothetical protein
MSIADDKLAAMIAQVKNRDIRTVLGLSEKHRKYPLDCVNDGGLELLVKYILALETTSGI